MRPGDARALSAARLFTEPERAAALQARMNQPSDPLGRLIRFVVRFVFVAAGAVFFMSLLLAGVIAAVAFTLWSLLRGRRPVAVDIFRFQQAARERARTGGFGARWNGGGMAAEAGDVVEVQAREVVRADQRLGGSRG